MLEELGALSMLLLTGAMALSGNTYSNGLLCSEKEFRGSKFLFNFPKNIILKKYLCGIPPRDCAVLYRYILK